jgi:hypothetical protein
MEAGIKAGQLLAVSGRHGMLALQRGCWRPAQLSDTTMHTVTTARQRRSCGFGDLLVCMCQSFVHHRHRKML